MSSNVSSLINLLQKLSDKLGDEKTPFLSKDKAGFEVSKEKASFFKARSLIHLLMDTRLTVQGNG